METKLGRYTKYNFYTFFMIGNRKEIIIMFRTMRRIKNQINTEDAKKLLERERRGVLAVHGDNGYPFAIPVNYYYDVQAQKIYFHGAKAGHKVDALKRDDKVCFTVYGNERIKKEEWAPYLQSVVIFGRCHLIDDPDKTIEKVRKLATKYYPNKEEVEMGIQKSIQATQLYEIEIEHMTGKQIQEK